MAVGQQQTHQKRQEIGTMAVGQQQTHQKKQDIGTMAVGQQQTHRKKQEIGTMAVGQQQTHQKKQPKPALAEFASMDEVESQFPTLVTGLWKLEGEQTILLVEKSKSFTWSVPQYALVLLLWKA